MSKKTQVIFDLPFDEYLKIDALSSSAVKTINVSISDYIEEKNQDTRTKSKDLGRAYHKRILEGLDAFNQSYVVNLKKEDYLNTVADIKSYLENKSVSFKGLTKKDDLEDLARDFDAPLFSDALENETREFISREYYDRINKFGDYLDKEISSSYKTEVTVLFDWDDVPCKARFDAVNESGILDLKTFSNPNKRSLEALPAQIISNYRYDIQALFYLEAYKKASAVNNLFKAKEPDFKFLFIQAQGGFNAIETILTSESHSMYLTNAYWQKALDDISNAISIYRDYINNNRNYKFKINREFLEDHDLPSYHFNK